MSQDKYLLDDIGKMFYRQRIIDQRIDYLKGLIDQSVQADETTELIGELSAFIEYRNAKHMKIVSELVNAKKTLEDNQYYDSIIDEEAFVKGYIEGLTTILKLDRELFVVPVSFVLFIYTNSGEIAHKYNAALSLYKGLYEYDTNEPIRYLVSESVEEICNKINELDSNTVNVICVVYENSAPDKEQLQKLSFEKNDNVFIVRDTDEVSVSNIIKRILRITTM